MKEANMKYRIYDTTTRSFVADDKNFILKPNGKLAINEYGDEIGVPYCVPIFFPQNNADMYIDNVGGVHGGGTAHDPNGNFCGECSIVSCEICSIWKRIKD